MRAGPLASRAVTALGLAALVLAAACSTSSEPTPAVVAEVASFELETGSAQRVLVGLFTDERELVGGGTAQLSFSFLGTKDDPVDETRPGMDTTARFVLLPGQPEGVAPTDGKPTTSTDATGLYRAEGVRFDDPGFWRVDVEIEVDGRLQRADAAFEVIEDSAVIEVGEIAPKTRNPLAGDASLPAEAIDSRSRADGSVPDPVLHRETVADAVASGRPVVVVVSTPTYCVSRFCGPITDAVAALADEHPPEQIALAHLEVWRDNDQQLVNDAAAEWIRPAATDGPTEPWVFVVGADGVVTYRFDDVVTTDELERAVDDVITRR